MGEVVCFSVILQAKVNVLEGKLKAVENSSHTKVGRLSLPISMLALYPSHVRRGTWLGYEASSCTNVTVSSMMQATTLESEVSQLQASVAQYEGLVTEYKSQVC